MNNFNTCSSLKNTLQNFLHLLFFCYLIYQWLSIYTSGGFSYFKRMSKYNVYCKIFHYVESVNPDLAELMERTCTSGFLNARGSGVTFLMPDTATIGKIKKLAQSAKVEDFDKATDMLKALIIRDLYKDANDFKSKKDDVPNSLSPNQHVEVDSIDGATVKFKSGATAVVDKDFVDGSPSRRLAVWKLTGEIPITTDKKATLKYAKAAGKKAVKGRYEVDYNNLAAFDERRKIMLMIENAYVVAQNVKNTPEKYDPYLRYLCSFVHYVSKHEPSLFYERVLPLLSFDKIDMYLFIEPHRVDDAYLISGDLIGDWFRNMSFDHSPREIVDMCNKAMEKAKELKLCTLYDNKPLVLAKIAELRARATQAVDQYKRTCPSHIQKIYDELESTNSIGGVANIYPKALASYYAANPGLKMSHDELRYLTHEMFCSIEKENTFLLNEFQDITNMIGDYLHYTGAERSKVRRLLNTDQLRYQIDPEPYAQEVRMFVNSTAFLHVGMSFKDCDDVGGQTQRPPQHSTILYNISKRVLDDKYHQRLIVPNAMDTDAIVSLIRSLDINKLDEQTRKLLAEKLGQ